MDKEDKQSKFAKLRRQAEELLQADATRPKALAPTQMQELLHELAVHQMELEVQNEDLRASQRALAEARDRYVDLYDFAPVGYFTLGAHGLIEQINLAGAALLGVERRFVKNSAFSRYIAEEFQTAFYAFTRNARRTGETQTCEALLIRSDGTRLFVRLEGLAAARENDGENCPLRIAVVDIDRRVRAEKALEAARDELEHCVNERTRKLVAANDELAQEIEQRKQALAELAQSEERYRGLIELSPDAIMVSRESRIVFVNSRGAAMLGVAAPEEMLGRNMYDFVHPESRDALVSMQAHVFETGRIVREAEARLVRADGTIVDVEKFAAAFTYDGKRALLCVFRDVTARRKDEVALRDSEQQFRRLFDESPVGAAILSPEGRFRNVNREFCRMTGYSRAELTAVAMADITHPADAERTQKLLGRLASGESHFVQLEKRYLRKDGEPIWGRVSIGVVKDDAGRPLYFVAIIQDITERWQKDEQIRSLTRELIRGQEREWQRVSRELHDVVGQDISVLRISLDTLFSDREAVPEKVGGKVSQMVGVVTRISDAIRDLSHSLRATDLDRIDLDAALRRLCEQFSDEGIEVDFMSAGIQALSLDFDTKVNLYRIVQEALQNIKKHAGAAHVTVRLVASFPKVVLRIQDDGKGFNVEQRGVAAFKEGRIGLCSMRERAAIAGGEMKIDSHPDKGTRIVVEVPVGGEKGEKS